MRKIISSTIILLAIALSAAAQKGNNQLQIGGQATFPIGNLADVAKTGYGVSAKGMYGFGTASQQATLEVGYNRLAVKNLPSGVKANYSAIPIYTGYRYLVGSFFFEPQAGVSFNKVVASSAGTTVSGNETNFGWATSVGYNLGDLEISVRYQSSDVKNSDVGLTFVGARLAYNFEL
jgi:hypothetical protein